MKIFYFILKWKKITTESIIDLKEKIKQFTKSHFVAKLQSNMKPTQNIANFGAKSGSVATMFRKGEYFGLSIQILEPIKPLFTDLRIIEALNMIENDNLIAATQY